MTTVFVSRVDSVDATEYLVGLRVQFRAPAIISVVSVEETASAAMMRDARVSAIVAMASGPSMEQIPTPSVIAATKVTVGLSAELHAPAPATKESATVSLLALATRRRVAATASAPTVVSAALIST